MTIRQRKYLTLSAMALLLVIVGVFQSWSLSLAILNLCIISAVMALGVNMQWGYAGLFNAGIMGFAALGGLAAIVIAMPPVYETWEAGGMGILVAALVAAITIIAGVFAWRQLKGVRRGSQNPRCMPRCGLPRKSNRNSIVANDDNYALAA
jgi:branched-chain amino acid transport system permease protein